MLSRLLSVCAALALVGCPGRPGADRDYPTPLSPWASPMAPSGYSVSWEDHAFPSRVERGSTVLASVRFRNSGDQVWRDAVKLTYRWRSGGQVVTSREGDNRTLLHRPVAPGEVVVLDRIPVRTPHAPGKYVLEFDLVNELVAFFSDKGAPPLSIPVEVN